MNEIYLIVISISLVVTTVISYASLLQITKSTSNFERTHKLNLEAQIINKRHLAMAEEQHLIQKRFVEKQLELRQAELELFKPTKTETT
jgi:Na+-transporting NADH:ubiquinone oxidoreductase subunit NqrC